MSVCAAICCAASAAGEVRVFAAASFSDAFREIAAAFERQSSNRVVLNFGASSTLGRQIEEGAPCDVFVSADLEQVDKLAARKLVIGESRQVVALNSLVIVTEIGSSMRIESPADLSSARRIALADPRTVPAGVYARRYLQERGLWAGVQPKVVPTQNVRAALAAVESGNVDAAIVYKTDAAISKKVRVAFEVPRSETPFIASSAARVLAAKNPAGARQFLEFLTSETSKGILRKFGFVLPDEPAKL
jgi:molybdate transport system substrate-binding protein